MHWTHILNKILASTVIIINYYNNINPGGGLQCLVYVAWYVSPFECFYSKVSPVKYKNVYFNLLAHL